MLDAAAGGPGHFLTTCSQVEHLIAHNQHLKHVSNYSPAGGQGRCWITCRKWSC